MLFAAAALASILCSGVNDTAVIQAAVNNNREVEILGQNCAIDGAVGIRVPSHTSIYASNSTFRMLPGCNFRCKVFETILGSTDIYFEGGTLVGDLMNHSGVEHRNGFRLDDTQRFRMVGTTIRGNRTDALWVGGNAGSHEISIERVLFEENGRSHVSLVNGSRISISNSVFRNTVIPPGKAYSDPGAGINVEGNTGDRVTDVTIRGNQVYGNVKGVVVIPGKGLPAQRVAITDNVVTGNMGLDSRGNVTGYGIIANSIQNGLIYNNRVSGSTLCVTIGGATEETRAFDLIVANNVIEGCANGLRLTGVRDSHVQGNEHPGPIQMPALGITNVNLNKNVQR